MSDRAHLFVALTTILSLFFVVRLVRRHHLKSKYSLLWLSIGVVMIALVAFPGLLDNASYKIGISYPPATFLVLSVAVLFMVVVQFSWELSRLEDRTRRLAEEVALLRAAHDDLVEAVREDRPPRNRVAVGPAG